jgi:ribA/ribD-fused uncharacterized protein
MYNRKTVKSSVPVSIRNRMDKIYSYIKYCQRLEDAYKIKHEEVRTLNGYLQRIKKVLPDNVSDNCPEVDDIITYVQGLPDVPDTDDLNENLRRMIDQQKVWREENDKNYNLINRKIDSLTETREVIVHGTKKETALLDGKDIKSLKIRGENVVPFYLPNDKHGNGFLSSYLNLKVPITVDLKVDGITQRIKFHSVSSAFLAKKTEYIMDKSIRKKYMSQLSKKIDYMNTQKIKKEILPFIKKNPKYTLTWNKNRYQIMKDLTKMKFKLNPELKNKLKNTGDSYLLEHPDTNNNTYWGDSISEDGKIEGANMMGKLLMELREEMFGIKSEFVKIKVSNMKKELNSITLNKTKLNKTANHKTKLNKTKYNKTANHKTKYNKTKKRMFGKK